MCGCWSRIGGTYRFARPDMQSWCSCAWWRSDPVTTPAGADWMRPKASSETITITWSWLIKKRLNLVFEESCVTETLNQRWNAARWRHLLNRWGGDNREGITGTEKNSTTGLMGISYQERPLATGNASVNANEFDSIKIVDHKPKWSSFEPDDISL